MITKEKIIEAIKSMNLYDEYILDYLDNIEEFNLTEDKILSLVVQGVLYYAGQQKFIKDNYSQLEAIGRLNADGITKVM